MPIDLLLAGALLLAQAAPPAPEVLARQSALAVVKRAASEPLDQPHWRTEPQSS